MWLLLIFPLAFSSCIELEDGACCIVGRDCKKRKNCCTYCPKGADKNDDDNKCPMRCRKKERKFGTDGACGPHEVPPQWLECPAGNCCTLGESCNHCPRGFHKTKKCDAKGEYMCNDKEYLLSASRAMAVSCSSSAIQQDNWDYYTPLSDLAWAENVKSVEDCIDMCNEWNLYRETQTKPKKNHFLKKQKFGKNFQNGKLGEWVCTISDSDGPCMSYTYGKPGDNPNASYRCWLKTHIAANQMPKKGYISGYPCPMITPEDYKEMWGDENAIEKGDMPECESVGAEPECEEDVEEDGQAQEDSAPVKATSAPVKATSAPVKATSVLIKTSAPKEETAEPAGACFKVECGCPPNWKESWCPEPNSANQSIANNIPTHMNDDIDTGKPNAWCLESESNCKMCNGNWCPQAQEDISHFI